MKLSYNKSCTLPSKVLVGYGGRGTLSCKVHMKMAEYSSDLPAYLGTWVVKQSLTFLD